MYEPSRKVALNTMQRRSHIKYRERLTELLTVPESTLARQDIHLYLDVSASIMAHRADYFELLRESITAARTQRRRLFVSLFGLSVYPETLQLNVQTETIESLWNQVCDILPIGEGTDVHCVWTHILAEPARNAQLSIMVTDGAWMLDELAHPLDELVLPQNLRYALVYTSHIDSRPTLGSTTERARDQVRMQNGYTAKWLEQLSTVDPSIETKLLNRTAVLRSRASVAA